MSAPVKAREWWIYDNGECPQLAWPKEHWDDYKDSINSYPDYHVIEYSYAARLEQALKVAREGLGDLMVWNCTACEENSVFAAKALKQIKEILGES